jgi:hypothetical protein
MAARKTTGPTRRQAVVALGAGLIGGTIDLSGAEQTPPPKSSTKAKTQKPATNPYADCAGKPTTEGYVDLPAKRQLQLSTCCEYAQDVLNNGYLKEASTETKTVLKRFMTMLAAEPALLDYCFIQFDVKKDKIEQVRNTVAGILKG